jgi:hypothetical protein
MDRLFNVTNGDFDRWENLWPRIAHFFKIEYAPPQRLPLTVFMSDKEPIWNNLVKKHNRLNYTFQEATAADAVFNLGYDVMSDITKLRRFGFHEWVETEEMLMRLFRQFQTMRFVP